MMQSPNDADYDYPALTPWAEVNLDFSRLQPRRHNADNAPVTYLGMSKLLAVRKWQLGNGMLYDEGIDWCYGWDGPAVKALLVAAALR